MRANAGIAGLSRKHFDKRSERMSYFRSNSKPRVCGMLVILWSERYSESAQMFQESICVKGEDHCCSANLPDFEKNDGGENLVAGSGGSAFWTRAPSGLAFI